MKTIFCDSETNIKANRKWKQNKESKRLLQHINYNKYNSGSDTKNF